jgi:hypothetical protein
MVYKKYSLIGGKELISAPPKTNLTIYLLFLYLFVVCIYCLFYRTTNGNQTNNQLENFGYGLLFIFEITLFAFILYQLYQSYFGSESNAEIQAKGIDLGAYLSKMIGNTEIVEKYGNLILYIFFAITIGYVIAFLFYLGNYTANQTIDIRTIFLFLILSITGLSVIIYRKMVIPISIILVLGIVLNIVSSVMTSISLANVPKDEKKAGYLNLPKSSAEDLKIYTSLTLTILGLMILLTTMLMTPNFKLSETEIASFQYGFTIFVSFALIVLSSLNIYYANNLLYSIINWKKWI